MNAPVLKPIRIEDRTGQEFTAPGKYVYVGEYLVCRVYLEEKQGEQTVSWNSTMVYPSDIFTDTNMKFSSYDNQHIESVIREVFYLAFDMDTYGWCCEKKSAHVYCISDGLWLTDNDGTFRNFSWMRSPGRYAAEIKYDRNDVPRDIRAFRTYYGCLNSHLPLRLMVVQHHKAADIMRGWDCQVHGMGIYFMKWCVIDGNTWVWRMVEPRPAFIGENINLNRSFTVDDNIKNLWDLSQGDEETGKQVWKGIRKEYL